MFYRPLHVEASRRIIKPAKFHFNKNQPAGTAFHTKNGVQKNQRRQPWLGLPPEKQLLARTVFLHLEQVGDGGIVVDVGDCLGEKRGNAHGIHTVTIGHGHGVGGEEALDGAVGQALAGGIGQHAVGHTGEDAGGAVLLENLGSGAEGAAGFGHIVHHENILTLHITDDGVGIHLSGGDTLLGHDGKLCTKNVGVALGVLHTTNIGGNHHEVVHILYIIGLEVLHEHRHAVEVVNRNVEITLNLIW